MGRCGFSKTCKQRKSWVSRRRERLDKDIRHRASPARIMKLYPHLTAEQRKLIEDAGFGGLLRMQCPMVPAKLCTWLLWRFDCESCELVIKGRGRIPVTTDSVHRVLGIPNSGRDVEYGLDEESINFVFEKYGVERPPSVVSLEKSIKQMKAADEHFLRTFMMIMLSTFLCPNTSLKISPRCFPALVDIGSIKELNWCKFVVEQLTKCISSYGKKCSVGGCLFYLVILYLDSLDTPNLEIPDGTPRISVWSRNLMDEAMVMDMKNNASFGKCFLKRGATGNINSRGASSASVLFADVSAIANFVQSNVLPGYSPQKKEALCNAASNLCSSITDALSKFMREVSALEDCNREAGKEITGAAPREDNNVENDGDRMDVDVLPDDSSELATKDIKGTSVKEYEDESSGEGEGEGETGDSSSTDSEDDPDWEDDSNRVKQSSNNSKEPGDGKTKPGKGTSKGSGHDSHIPEGDQGRRTRCREEHVNVAKPKSDNVHEDVVVPTSAMSQARSTQQKNSEKRCVIADKIAIQFGSPLHSGPSTVKLYDKGSPSKEGRNMDKNPIIDFLEVIPVIDLSTPTSSDSDCTVIRTVANPYSSVDGPKKSS